MPIITDEFISSGATNGSSGWNKEQLKCLGVKLPLRSGWREEVEGKNISPSQAAKFLSLRNRKKTRYARKNERKQVKQEDEYSLDQYKSLYLKYRSLFLSSQNFIDRHIQDNGQTEEMAKEWLELERNKKRYGIVDSFPE